MLAFLAPFGAAALRWLVPSAAVWLAGKGVGEAGKGAGELAQAGTRSIVGLAVAAGIGALAMNYFGGRRVLRRY